MWRDLMFASLVAGGAVLLSASSVWADGKPQLPADHPLAKLKPGMSQQAVEKILGKPAKLTDGGVIGEDGTRFATYYLAIPNYPGQQLMTVHYRLIKGEWNFHEWRGPHIPNDPRGGK